MASNPLHRYRIRPPTRFLARTRHVWLTALALLGIGYGFMSYLIAWANEEQPDDRLTATDERWLIAHPDMARVVIDWCHDNPLLDQRTKLMRVCIAAALAQPEKH